MDERAYEEDKYEQEKAWEDEQANLDSESAKAIADAEAEAPMDELERVREEIKQIADEADEQNNRDVGNWEHYKDLLVESLFAYLHSKFCVKADDQSLPKSKLFYDRDLASGELSIAWQRKYCVITGDEAKAAQEAINETLRKMITPQGGSVWMKVKV